MTSFSRTTAPGPLLPDTQPGNLPSQPPNVGLWTDSDVGLPQGPATAFVTNQASTSENEMPTIGHIGRYALKYRIGAGGLGTVYAAHDPLLSRLVAIKTVSLDLSADERESFNALFLDEARAAGGLSHPHIVTVFDAGVSDNSAYIAMEMLKGRDLRQLRQEGWRPSPAQAALIVRRVADALAYAHSKGVVHRDVKPANIFMVGRTQPRVLDFGIARVAHRHEIGSSGDIAAGSPYYMAPEQARHQVVDRRADVFSLGVVLYELLTDRKPFRGETLAEITNAVLTHEPMLASEVDRKVPLGLAEIAARAMLKDPEQRYRSARAFSRDLRHWLDDNAANQEGEVPAPRPRPRLTWVHAALASVVVAGAVLAVMLAPRQKAAAPAVASGSAADPARAGAGAAPSAPVAVAQGPDAATPSSASTVVSTVMATSAASAAVAPATAASPSTPGVAATVAVAGAAAAAAAAATTPAKPRPAPAAVPKPAAGKAPDVAKPAAAKAAPSTAKATPPTAKAAVAPKSPPAAKNNAQARPPEAKATVAAAPVVKTNGTLRIAISPWGQVEVDGVPAGTAPPLNELTLSEGKHQIVIRNGDFAPFRTTVTVTGGQAVTVKHRFGP